MNFIRSGYLLLLCGLCSCASSFTPPAEGPTAKIKKIQYDILPRPAFFLKGLSVMIHDIDNEGCLVNARKVSISDPEGILVPANKLVGMSFRGTATADEIDFSYQATCDMRFGMWFKEDQEYVFNIRHGTDGCFITAFNASTPEVLPLEQVNRTNAFQNYCIAERF